MNCRGISFTCASKSFFLLVIGQSFGVAFRSLWVATFLVVGGMPGRTEAQIQEFEGIRHRVYRIDPAREKLEVFWKDSNGQPFTTFKKLQTHLATQGKQLRFATNAGIYEPGFIPTGLHIENGKTLVPLNRQPGPKLQPGQYTPNFYLKPNGVFFIDDLGPAVIETEKFAVSGRNPNLAVQSGPLLLAEGQVHPIFGPTSTSRLLRNGVGVDREGNIVFVSTERSERGRVNLHTFARLFLSLDCPNALYLDGDISEFYRRTENPEVQATTSFGAIFAVTEPLDSRR